MNKCSLEIFRFVKVGTRKKVGTSIQSSESHRDGISNRCYEMAPSAPRFDWMRDP